jgi:hypothetical protein
LFLEDVAWPRKLSVLVLAPHPDDFDSIAISLRFFHERGAAIRLAVLSSSASGVEDTYSRPPSAAVKAAIREAEQRASCRMFGLQEAAIEFLRTAEDRWGQPVDSEENFALVGRCLERCRPGLVFLPHGNDTNAGHRLTFGLLRRNAAGLDWGITALLNRDPKTIAMRTDLYTFFGEAGAAWKGTLLRCHDSQQRRNLNTRGYGFDERILRVNREAAREVPGRGEYAEVFEIWQSK